MERETEPVGVTNQVMRVVRKRRRVPQGVGDGGEIPSLVMRVAHEHVSEIRPRKKQSHLDKVAVPGDELDAAAGRFVDRHDAAVLPLEVQPVAAQVGDTPNAVLGGPTAVNACEILGEVVNAIVLGANLEFGVVIGEPGAVHQLELGALFAEPIRQLREEQRAEGRMVHRHRAVGGIDFQPRVRERVPTESTRAFTRCIRGIAAHPVDPDAPGQGEV